MTEIGFEINDAGDIIYYVVGKKVSKEQVKIVEKAFEDKMNDPKFKKELEEKAQ